MWLKTTLRRRHGGGIDGSKHPSRGVLVCQQTECPSGAAVTNLTKRSLLGRTRGLLSDAALTTYQSTTAVPASSALNEAV